MKRFIGKKIINAVAMTRLAYNELRGWKLPEDENGADDGYLIHDTDCGEYSGVEGFDGYIQWMPKKAFYFMYSSIENMAFGLAIEALKQGKKVVRAGWNGKGMWLSYVRYSENNLQEYDNHYHLHNVEAEGLPWIGMKTADDKFVPWLASQTDMLSEDWKILEG